MERYLQIFRDGYTGYANYLWQEITNPHWKNYFYWLIGVSLFFFALEILKPWRKDQPRFRRDFWLDAFYVLFNYFLFSLIGFAAASEVAVQLFRDGLGACFRSGFLRGGRVRVLDGDEVVAGMRGQVAGVHAADAAGSEESDLHGSDHCGRGDRRFR